ncbi:hypothetical protein psyc5s11_14850 [Clostridium gelidum]|uniref:GtrA/DPMS transmembrane domain-containing protein n=1 Tax=Clostridium gelidum TaxID=704125 RepID=A0ABN6IV17_9CLOT|nr:GtrA family protein [Clostridium gelidum]BCZ45418.1 hypothetical protein psyc5s11_14850 [Clostridium gelidum]
MLSRFSIVGVLNTLIDFVTFTIINSWFGINYTTSQMSGYSVGVVNSYIFNKNWTFEDKDANKKIVHEFLKFILTIHSPYIIQSLIYYVKKNMTETVYYTVEHFRDLGYAESKKEIKPLNIIKDLTNPILKVRGF